MTIAEFSEIVNSLGFQKYKEYTDTNGKHDIFYVFDMCRSSESISITLEKDNTVKIWAYSIPMTIYGDNDKIVMSKEFLIRSINDVFNNVNISGLEKKYYLEKSKPVIREMKLNGLGI